MIGDPRAGHEPGFGGSKTDSEVGVALEDGHPVYFVAFHPEPVPRQTIADVTHSQTAFLREIARRHPESPKPVVVGNCQASWATAILAADIGRGVFDGAHLVENFESLNAGRTWFREYADVFADPEGPAARFLEFEHCWGGFFMMTRDEMRWIMENPVVDSRLDKNEAFLKPGRPIDLRRITAPIICFACHGDSITLPAQALD